jgi:hypothetical protein
MYSQMLWEADHTKFFEAMEIEISDHEKHRHWDLMLHTAYLSVLKQSWPFGHSSARGFPMECLISIKPDYVLMEVNRLGVKMTGILMLLSLHGLAFDFCLLWPRFMVSNLKA